jgi:DNA-binding transcriptional LysR family regulator
MDISAADLTIFMTVSHEGSVTRGASRLGLSQPAVSRSIQRLEQELGAEVFARSKRGVVLTRAGSHLLASSKRLLDGFESVKRLIKSDSQEPRGIYSIGVHADLAGHTVPKFMASLLKEFQDLEFQLVHDLSRELTKKVINFELEFGIVVNPVRHPDLTIVKLYSDEVGFWVKKGESTARLLRQKRVPIICNPDLLQTTNLLARIRKEKVLEEPRLVHTTNLHLIADLVASGAGVGIVPASTALLHNSPQIRPITRLPIHKDTICLIYRHEFLRGTAGMFVKQKIVEALAV